MACVAESRINSSAARHRRHVAAMGQGGHLARMEASGTFVTRGNPDSHDESGDADRLVGCCSAKVHVAKPW